MDIAALKNAIAADAAAIDAAIRADLTRQQGEIDGLLAEILQYGVLAGGKYIRPLLVILAARLCGSTQKEVYQLAIAFEYLHNATLFHDDVIDQAALRRGKASVWRQYGSNAAILAGDYLHARAMHIVGEMSGAPGLAIFCQATSRMVSGEFLQARMLGRPDLSREEYFSIIRQKTGVLIAACCQIGALFAGASQAQQQALYDYGENLGTAFQIIDDVLDYQGNSAQTGKELGTDLVEGKVTLPLLLLWERASAVDREEIRMLLEKPPAEPQLVAAMRQRLQYYDCLAAAKEEARAISHRCTAALDIFTEAPAEVKTLLRMLAAYVVAREK